ncbi:hypothetical protein JTE90_021469 [Oedothorax gibbosus]|uniref:Uncharacterized protein n=1 Tax=Oedothorax gibbosus TaxID=931172 RepID=A0AAV6VWP4_9ARAC|nr:hypothetical protein JTE90_021469 [Oedothorax gibbosus]
MLGMCSRQLTDGEGSLGMSSASFRSYFSRGVFRPNVCGRVVGVDLRVFDKSIFPWDGLGQNNVSYPIHLFATAPFANVIPQSLGGTAKVRTNIGRRKKEHKSHGARQKKSVPRIFRSVASSAHNTAGHRDTRRTWSILFRTFREERIQGDYCGADPKTRKWRPPGDDQKEKVSEKKPK